MFKGIEISMIDQTFKSTQMKAEIIIYNGSSRYALLLESKNYFRPDDTKFHWPEEKVVLSILDE